MKKVLIATQNKDKFQSISALLEGVFPNKFRFVNLKDAGIELEIIETGSIIERAMQKAKEYWKYLKMINQKDYYITIGVDDGFSLTKKDEGDSNSKWITEEILKGKLLKKSEKIWLKRGIAYCNDKSQRAILTSTPLVYLGNPDKIELTQGTYPLRNVLAPINSDKVQSQIEFDDLIQYFLKYCSKDIYQLLTDV